MLKSLNIIGFAVIDRLSVNFHPGLNVLTGETGSGKSIIVDALGLLLGERGSSVQIRTGEDQASIEGHFQFERRKAQEIHQTLPEIGLEDCSELIIRREISTTSRGRAFLNGRTVTTGFLRKLQPFLSEIYGQGEQRSLLSSQSHRELLDDFGVCSDLKHQVRRIFTRLRTVERELNALAQDLAERERSRDYLQHQLREIESINPQSGEDIALLAERKVLANAERIIELSSNAYYHLYESDESLLARLTQIRRQLEELGSFIGDADVALESLLSGIASLTDVAEALRGYVAQIEYSPARLADVEARLAELEKLKRKFGVDLDGLIKLREELREKATGSSNLADRIENLKIELEDLQREYIASTSKLTACRRAAIPTLEQKVMEGLSQVAMGQAKFLINLETRSLEDEESLNEYDLAEKADVNSDSAFFSPNGTDYVEFLLSANPGESPRPLSSVASGGELSRLMLTLRTAAQSEDALETIVFDEIDTGIGGRVAEAVGQLLKSLSSSRQVFCVTHQAQIAKFADHHFVVTKVIERERTQTLIRELTKDERINELSRMIGGDEKALKTREAAQWLLENAKSSRKRRAKS